MDMYQLAQALFGKGDQDSQSGYTTTMYGTATSDSDNGRVDVIPDGSIIGGGGSNTAEVNMATVVAVKNTDRVIITVVDGVPVVTGVVGEGDRSRADYQQMLADLSDRMDTALADATKLVEEAQEVANATNQHFWDDDNGVHVSDEDKNPAGPHNILINSLGFLLRLADKWLVTITKSAITFYDGDGNEPGNVLAHFGRDNATIGSVGSWHARMDATGYTIYDGSKGADGSDNIVSSFGRKVIAIGKSYSDAIIWFCNGSASLSYGRSKHYNGMGMILHSNDQLEMNGSDYCVMSAGDDAGAYIYVNKSGDITFNKRSSSSLEIYTFMPKYFHQLYCHKTEDHYVTSSADEISKLTSGGDWVDQGVVFTSFG